MESTNPFRPTRFEHARRPILWISPRVVELEEAKSFYIFGTRGSGKTSLLKALNWEERLSNESIRPQLRDEDEAVRFVSIYIRLPDYVSKSFAEFDWSRVYQSASMEAVRESVFALFIELVCCRLISEALARLRVNERVFFTDGAEHAFVKIALDRVPELAEAYGLHRLKTMADLQKFFRYYHEYIRKFLIRGGTASEFDFLPLENAGRIFVSFAKDAMSLVEQDERNRLQHFKICIDDCETLTPSQQRYLNTLVRSSTAPVFWTVSYTDRNYETAATTIVGQTLSDADRKVVNLDNEPPKSFRRLCEHVSGMRFWYAEEADKPKTRADSPDIGSDYFQLNRILGETDINRFLIHIRRTSVSSTWDEVERDALTLKTSWSKFTDQLRDNTTNDDDFPEADDEKGQLPLYQAFVLRRLGEFDDALQAKSPGALKAIEARVRRKQVAALLVMCARLRANVPYAGWQAVLALSDGCIRDYLEIMAEIFDAQAAARPTRRSFRQQTVNYDLQRTGIVAAGKSKIQSIVDNAESYTAEAFKLIACLGELSRRLQSDPNSADAIRAAERGIYSVNYEDGLASARPNKDQAESSDLVRAVIRECQTYGFLRAVVPQGQLKKLVDPTSAERRETEVFRLHRRFAPAFGLSYRGPYSRVILPLSSLVEICKSQEAVEPVKWAVAVQRKVRIFDDDGLEPQLKLLPEDPA